MEFPYINGTLLPDEHIIKATRPSLIIFTPCVISIIISLMVFHYGPRLFFTADILFYGLRMYQWIGIVALAYSLYSLGDAFIYYFTSEYGITNRRVLMKTGWIQRDSLEVFMRRVEAIKVYQSVWGRVFGYGTLIVIGTGGTEDPFFYVPMPLKFRKMVQRQMELDMEAEDGAPHQSP